MAFKVATFASFTNDIKSLQDILFLNIINIVLLALDC